MNENTLKLNLENGRYGGAFTITFQVEAEIVRRALFRYAEEHNVDPANIEEWGKAIQAVTSSARWIDHPRATWLDYPHAKPAHAQPISPEPKQASSVVVAPKPERIQEDEIVSILKRAGQAMGIADILAQMETKPLYDTLNKRLLRKVEQGVLIRPATGKYAIANAAVVEPKPQFTFNPGNHAPLSSEDEQALRELALQVPVDEWNSLLTPIPNGSRKEKQPVYQRRYAEKQALARLKAELEPAHPETLHAIADAVNGVKMR